MKLLLILLIIIPCTGCLPRAMNEAHRQEGEILVTYNQKANELHLAMLKDFKETYAALLNVNESWMIERETDASGNISTETLERIRANRRQVELVSEERFNRIWQLWEENEKNFNAAMELHEAVQAWLGAVGLF